MPASYREAYKSGLLQASASCAFQRLASCDICPRKCGVNRLRNERGYCKTGLLPKVCSFMPHRGEEPPISGSRGSGTIFFSHCNLSCAYCQNYEFSQEGQGREVDFGDLAGFMLELQKQGCHNINLVTPTHVMPQILKALIIAVEKGLHIPLVYNTGGYELAGAIRLLVGIVDIYLPDMRYADEEAAVRYSQAPGYPAYNQEAVKEMFRQAGNAVIGEDGIIKKGVIIRHLVLPHNLSGTERIMRFISRELGPDAFISLMSQYLPYYKASEYKEISRRLLHEEYAQAIETMHGCGLYNGWIQESYGLERFAGVNIKPS
jgi:putative pyruvate formate lyase activating enzyme